MLSSDHEFTDLDSGDVLDTYWNYYIVCNNSCPLNDPLFGGIDSPDSVSRLLQGFVPSAGPLMNLRENSYSVEKTVNIPVAQRTSFQINETPTFQPSSQPIEQLVNQPVNQPIIQSSGLAINQPVINVIVSSDIATRVLQNSVIPTGQPITSPSSIPVSQLHSHTNL